MALFYCINSTNGLFSVNADLSQIAAKNVMFFASICTDNSLEIATEPVQHIWGAKVGESIKYNRNTITEIQLMHCFVFALLHSIG